MNQSITSNLVWNDISEKKHEEVGAIVEIKGTRDRCQQRLKAAAKEKDWKRGQRRGREGKKRARFAEIEGH